MHEVFVSTPAWVIDQVTFYGNASGTDPATGQPARYLVLTVSAPRELFTTLVAGRAGSGRVPAQAQCPHIAASL